MTDTEWAILEPLIPEAGAGGRPRSVDMREIINAIFYVLICGVAAALGCRARIRMAGT